MDQIIGCIDGSTYFAGICDAAAWAAGRTASRVELLHVLGRREVPSVPTDLSGTLVANQEDTLLAELAAYDAERAKLTNRRGRLLLDQGKERLESAGIAVATCLRNGDLVTTLAEQGPTASLIVIGKRGEASHHAHGHLGSNLERVVRASQRPILVTPSTFPTVKGFLIAYDAGPSAERAIELAASNPLLRGLDCHILMVGSGQAAAAHLESAKARLVQAGVQAKAVLAPGHAEDVIAAHLERSGLDLLVMGAYGHSRIRSLMVGSTTTAVVRAAHVPVLLVR